ncbi:MAG: PKD domain-containing protein [Bacteroidota bacterium]
MRYKYFVYTFCFLILSLALKAQPGCPNINAGPDQNLDCITTCTDLTSTYLATGATTTYAVSSIPYNPPYPYNTGNPILVSTDDIWSGVINLPFNFCFFGTQYSQILVGSNGCLSFSTVDAGGYCAWSYTVSCPDPSIISGSTGPFILGPFHDIDPGVGGAIYEAVLGSYPCRTFVVNYNVVPMFSCNSLIATHQIVLYESTNVIEVYIQNKPVCSTWNGGLATIGIQDAAGTTGFSPPGRNTGQWTASNEAWRFTPNGAQNYTVSWWQGTTQLNSAATINVCPTTTTVYTAQILYDCCFGNQDVTDTDNVTVNVINSIGLNIAPANPTICEGNSSTLTASSTNPSATYQWSTGSPNASITVSPSTTTVYTVTATTPGCTATSSVTVNVDAQPTVTVNNAAVCQGQPATLTANGAASYLWNTGDITNSITVSPSATTSYTVTGSNNACTSTAIATVTVNENPVIQISYTNATCGLPNGTITATPTNSCTTGFSYNWNTVPTQTLQTAINLPAGTFTVTVSCGSCSSTASATITNTAGPSVTITNIINASCGFSNGSATTNATGGTTPYLYSWNSSPQQSGTVLQNVPAGTYNVTVTDFNGCTATNTVTIGGTVPPTASTSVTSETCDMLNGTATVTASGGTGSYTYSWNSNPPQYTYSATGLASGSYTVTVNDGLCTVTAIATVPSLPGPTAGFSAQPQILTPIDGPVSFLDNSSGNIVTWDWNFGDGTSNGSGNELTHTYENLGTFLVTLIVTDNNGCTDTTQDTIKVKEIFTLYIPSSFTPNGDGINDYWTPKGLSVDPDNFDMFIFDRWGNLMFHTSKWFSALNQCEPWNGTFNNKGNFNDILMDIYIYRIKVKELEGPKHEYIGKITLAP